jgi:transposase
MNQARGLLAEFGITVPQGANRLRKALPDILEDPADGLPDLAREIIADLGEQLRELDQCIEGYDRRIRQLANTMPQAKRLMAVDGVGPVIATALIATAGGARLFDLAGLVARDRFSDEVPASGFPSAPGPEPRGPAERGRIHARSRSFTP